MVVNNKKIPAVEVGEGVEERTFFSASYHPFRYFSVRPGKELHSLMENFLALMETPDEEKTKRETFQLSSVDIALKGLELWDVVLREAILYSQFMRKSRSKGGELLLSPPATIFHLHPHLVEKYRTDNSVKNLSCEELQESCPPVYIYFGKEAGVTTSDGQKAIDGAYILSDWNADKKSLIVEVLLTPETLESVPYLLTCSTLKRMMLDQGYIYFWLGFEEGKRRTVYESLEKNLELNSQGFQAHLLLGDQIQLDQALAASQVLVPFLRTMTKNLSLAREYGLGRKEDCDSMDTNGIHMERRVIGGVEILLVDER